MTIDYSTIDTDRGDQGNVYIYGYHWTCLFKGSLEAKLPTVWTDGKGTARKKLGHEESQKGEDQRWRRSEMETVRKEKMQVSEKVRKSQNTVFFQCFVAPEGRKVGGDIWASGQMTNENLNAVVA